MSFTYSNLMFVCLFLQFNNVDDNHTWRMDFYLMMLIKIEMYWKYYFWRFMFQDCFVCCCFAVKFSNINPIYIWQFILFFHDFKIDILNTDINCCCYFCVEIGVNHWYSFFFQYNDFHLLLRRWVVTHSIDDDDDGWFFFSFWYI